MYLSCKEGLLKPSPKLHNDANAESAANNITFSGKLKVLLEEHESEMVLNDTVTEIQVFFSLSFVKRNPHPTVCV